MSSERTHTGLSEELSRMREQLRLQAHLGGLEARAAWQRFEQRFMELERQLEQRGAQALDVAGNLALELARALIQHVPEGELGRTPVLELMQVEVATCAPDDSLRLVAERMAEQQCGALVVVSAQRQPIAMLTDRDLALALGSHELPLSELRVWNAMSRAAHCCTGECSLVDALAVMRTARVRRLPVIDTMQRLIGLISLDDVACFVQARVPAGIPTALQAEVSSTLAAVAMPVIVRRRAARASAPSASHPQALPGARR